MADIAAGERVVVRDEEWLVRAVRNTKSDGARVEVTGVTCPSLRMRIMMSRGSTSPIARLKCELRG